MAQFLYANNAITTLAGPIAASSITVNLAAGSGALFPNPGTGQQFALTLVSAGNANIIEIAYCTARSGDTLTIARGQENTSATAFVAGDKASNDLTAGSCAALIQVAQLQQDASNYGVDTGSVNALNVTLVPAPGSLSLMVGSPVRVLVKNTNTGSSTLTLNTLSATSIVTQDGSALGAGAMIANCIYEFVYVSGIGFEIQSPYTILNRTNTWLQNQIYANNAALDWKNTSGTTIPVLNSNASNQTIIYSGSGTPPLVFANQGGQTIASFDNAGNETLAAGLTVGAGLAVTGSGSFGGTVTISPATVGGNAARLDQIGTNIFTNIQLVTGSRALQTNYTNSNGKPIFVSVTAISASAGGNLFIIVNGVTQYTFGQPVAGGVTSVTGIVPASGTYGVFYSVSTFTLQAWTETS